MVVGSPSDQGGHSAAAENQRQWQGRIDAVAPDRLQTLRLPQSIALQWSKTATPTELKSNRHISVIDAA
jgi:hypothetical protein